MPYFVLGACVGPHGTIPEKKLGSRHISVPLSGSCDKTVESGDHEHLVSSAGGTLEIRR